MHRGGVPGCRAARYRRAWPRGGHREHEGEAPARLAAAPLLAPVRYEGGGVMRVVVTGSSGRIGQQVVKELAANDYQVIASDIARAPRDLPAGVQYVQADMTQPGDVAGVLTFRGKKPDAVLHLAAIPNPTKDPPEVVYGTNVLSVYNVVEMV